MKEIIIAFAKDFPPEWAVFFLSMVPLTELRAAIPVGITLFHLDPARVLLWAVLGNTVLGAFVLLAMHFILPFLLHFRFFRQWWERYCLRLQKNHRKAFQRWGALALVTFVAIPLPMTGVFTGAVASSLFRVPFLQTLLLLFLGASIAGVLVTLLTVFGVFLAT